MRYIGFAIADSMLPRQCVVRKMPIAPSALRLMLADAPPDQPWVVIANPSHAATFDALRRRFGIDLPVPDRAPVVSLAPGDELIVCSVRGLPRLADRHEYTPEEIEGAEFACSYYRVVE